MFWVKNQRHSFGLWTVLKCSEEYYSLRMVRPSFLAWSILPSVTSGGKARDLYLSLCRLLGVLSYLHTRTGEHTTNIGRKKTILQMSSLILKKSCILWTNIWTKLLSRQRQRQRSLSGGRLLMGGEVDLYWFFLEKTRLLSGRRLLMGDEKEESSKQDHKASHSNCSIPANTNTNLKPDRNTNVHTNTNTIAKAACSNPAYLQSKFKSVCNSRSACLMFNLIMWATLSR